jgi:hypothetical protein
MAGPAQLDKLKALEEIGVSQLAISPPGRIPRSPRDHSNIFKKLAHGLKRRRASTLLSTEFVANICSAGLTVKYRAKTEPNAGRF